jgi:transposase
VYRYLHLAGPPERRRPGRRPSPQRAAWEAFIARRWEEGCHNGRRLWREARAAGYHCSDSSVARFVADLRRLGPQRLRARRTGGAVTSVQGPTARHVALLLLRPPAKRTPEQALYAEHLCQCEPTIATAHALVQAFVRMLHERQGERLDAWVEEAAQSGIAELHRFAQGLTKDRAAVRAGLSVDYSNGQTEGQILRLKLIRRSMYGRGKFDLLERRVLEAA